MASACRWVLSAPGTLRGEVGRALAGATDGLADASQEPVGEGGGPVNAMVPGVDFEPDIVVTSPGESSAHLVVEAKLGAEHDRNVVAALKHYMLRMRSPAGILVTLATG